MSTTTTLSNRAIRTAALLAVLLLCAACSAVSGGIKSPENLPNGPSALASGQKIGRVAVSLDQHQLLAVRLLLRAGADPELVTADTLMPAALPGEQSLTPRVSFLLAQLSVTSR